MQESLAEQLRRFAKLHNIELDDTSRTKDVGARASRIGARLMSPARTGFLAKPPLDQLTQEWAQVESELLDMEEGERLIVIDQFFSGMRLTVRRLDKDQINTAQTILSPFTQDSARDLVDFVSGDTSIAASAIIAIKALHLLWSGTENEAQFKDYLSRQEKRVSLSSVSDGSIQLYGLVKTLSNFYEQRGSFKIL